MGHSVHCLWATLYIVYGPQCTLFMGHSVHCLWATLYIVYGPQCTLFMGHISLINSQQCRSTEDIYFFVEIDKNPGIF